VTSPFIDLMIAQPALQPRPPALLQRVNFVAVSVSIWVARKNDTRRPPDRGYGRGESSERKQGDQARAKIGNVRPFQSGGLGSDRDSYGRK
jgi:hypothetical protein